MRFATAAGPGVWAGPWTVGTGLLAGAGLAGLRPMVDYLGRLPGLSRHTEVYVTFDTVSYHLPGLSTAARHHSLWESNASPSPATATGSS